MDKAREASPQLVEPSEISLGTQAGEQSSLKNQSAGLEDKVRGHISNSDRQSESPKVVAQNSYDSRTKNNTSVPSADESQNETSSRAVEEKEAAEPSTTTVEALSNDRKAYEGTTQSAQAAPLGDHPKTFKNLQKDKERRNERTQKLRNDKEELREEIRDLKYEIQALKEEREEREARFQEAQEDALALLERDAIDALPDDEVQNEIKQIFTRSRQWTKKWAVSNPVVLNNVQGSTQGMLNGPSGEKSASRNGMRAVLSGILSPRHILTALVTRHLAINLFQRPFFYLHNFNQGGHQKSREKQLLSVQEMGIGSSLYLLCVGKY
jgi:hypothetical protein